MTPRRIWLGARSAGGLALPAANPTASQLYAPRGVWLDGQRLCVADSGNHRVLIWNSLPTVDQAPADIVLGQASFTAEGPAAQGRGPENGFHLPTGLIVVGNALLVTDPWHHRVLVWNQVPTVSDTPPDFCLGQKSLHDVERNRGGEVGRDTLYWPYGVAWIGGRLHVADTGNRRVLIWNGLPTADAPADVVLGQSDACSAEENRGGPVGPASFRWPHALAGTAEQLWVADAGNHRVLGWQGAPAGDRPADWVVGQENFTSNWEMPHQAQGPARLRFPYSVSWCDNTSAGGERLVVADTANNRILLFGLPLPKPAGSNATEVLGQVSFAGSGENRWEAVLPDTLCGPYGISQHGGRLAVADSGNNRVMLWDLPGALGKG